MTFAGQSAGRSRLRVVVPEQQGGLRGTEGVVLRHLEWCQMRNLSPLTIRARRLALDRLARTIRGPVLYATHAQLSEWQLVRSRIVAPATRRTELSTVRAFYRWCVTEEYIPVDPTLRLAMPKVAQRFPRPIPDDRLAAALDAGEPYTRAIIGLAAFAGLRAVEVARLDWAEVDLEADQPILMVARGKGDRPRMVPLSPVIVEILTALPYRHGPVIPRRDLLGGNNSANAITKVASRHLKACGFPERLHSGRHRFATAAYRGTLDIRAVQSLLGHSSPTTTSVYAAASDGAAAAAADAAGHLAR